MLSWFQALMPKEEKFFDHFERHARTLVEGAKTLRSLLEGGDNVSRCCAEIVRLEHEADTITRDVLLAVRRTFITPFDRSDIRDLITAMDDAIDQMQQTAKAITLYEVTEFDPLMRTMGDLVVQVAEITEKAIPLLRAMSANAAKLNAASEEITRIEEISDQLHDQGLKNLFRAHRSTDPMAFIVGSEIYSHLEKVVDSFEDVADRVSGIVLEHV